jgi:transcription initiation factor TFIIIB Brf1 subunit/transcription initiation factor TFIIB
MAVDLRCPNCEDNLGKDKENYVVAHCGTCDTQFFNDEGFDWDELSDEDKKWIKDNGHKKRKTFRYIRRF